MLNLSIKHKKLVANNRILETKFISLVTGLDLENLQKFDLNELKLKTNDYNNKGIQALKWCFTSLTFQPFKVIEALSVIKFLLNIPQVNGWFNDQNKLLVLGNASVDFSGKKSRKEHFEDICDHVHKIIEKAGIHTHPLAISVAQQLISIADKSGFELIPGLKPFRKGIFSSAWDTISSFTSSALSYFSRAEQSSAASSSSSSAASSSSSSDASSSSSSDASSSSSSDASSSSSSDASSSSSSDVIDDPVPQTMPQKKRSRATSASITEEPGSSAIIIDDLTDLVPQTMPQEKRSQAISPSITEEPGSFAIIDDLVDLVPQAMPQEEPQQTVREKRATPEDVIEESDNDTDTSDNENSSKPKRSRHR